MKQEKPRVYNRYWNEIMIKEWPKPGEIYICKDPQKTLGSETWSVSIMGNRTLKGDTVQQGLFWKKTNAKIFAQTLVDNENT